MNYAANGNRMISSQIWNRVKPQMKLSLGDLSLQIEDLEHIR